MRRPRDFFGPDDYVCGDPREEEHAIRQAQAAWDARRAALPWWRRMLVDITGQL